MTVETKSFSVDSAMEAVEGSIAEVAETALDLECKGPLPSKGAPNLTGAYLPLVCESWTMGLAIASDQAGCVRLASALMMIDEPDEELPAEDIADAIGEIANLLAGGVKQRLHERFSTVQLGTPVIFQGRVEALERQELAISEFNVGGANVEIMALLTL